MKRKGGVLASTGWNWEKWGGKCILCLWVHSCFPPAVPCVRPGLRWAVGSRGVWEVGARGSRGGATTKSTGRLSVPVILSNDFFLTFLEKDFFPNNSIMLLFHQHQPWRSWLLHRHSLQGQRQKHCKYAKSPLASNPPQPTQKNQPKLKIIEVLKVWSRIGFWHISGEVEISNPTSTPRDHRLVRTCALPKEWSLSFFCVFQKKKVKFFRLWNWSISCEIRLALYKFLRNLKFYCYCYYPWWISLFGWPWNGVGDGVCALVNFQTVNKHSSVILCSFQFWMDANLVALVDFCGPFVIIVHFVSKVDIWFPTQPFPSTCKFNLLKSTYAMLVSPNGVEVYGAGRGVDVCLQHWNLQTTHQSTRLSPKCLESVCWCFTMQKHIVTQCCNVTDPFFLNGRSLAICKE